MIVMKSLHGVTISVVAVQALESGLAKTFRNSTRTAEQIY
jgi:hypothetical protein